MKVAINGRPLESGISGIERFTYELINNCNSKGVKYDILLLSAIRSEFNALLNKNTFLGSDKLEVSAMSKALWEAIRLNKYLNISEASIYHGPSFFTPLFRVKSKKYIITVHDLIFLDFPNYFDKKTLMLYKLLFTRSLRMADHIVCVSFSAKSDLIRHFPFCRDKTSVIYNGFTPIRNASEVSPHVKVILTDRYFLVVGSISKRKNIVRVTNAFISARDKAKIKGKLVIVGPVNEDEKLNDPDVIYTGYVSESDLYALYKNSFASIFASLYEGFGFPILESMYFGKPIITSNISSMPEVSGYPHDWLVNPLDADDIAQRIAEICTSEELYSEMVKHGYEQVKKFSWDLTAENYIKLYKRLEYEFL